MAQRLRISEIFLSLQGESRTVGWPTVFVRLTGCPLRCRYCDTEYAFGGGEWMDLETILDRVRAYRVRHVTVTGGEPLAQPAAPELLGRLCDLGLSVSLETSGALSVAGLDPRVVKVMDLKTPASGESHRNHWPNLEYLRPDDQVKFVIADEADYRWSKAVVQEHDLATRCEVLFSPVHGRLPARDLADWIVRDRLPVRFQIQLHKALWGEEPGR